MLNQRKKGPFASKEGKVSARDVGLVPIEELEASALRLRSRQYLGPHYDRAKTLAQRDPAFFPDPDTTTFRVVVGDELDAARTTFVDSGLRGHHRHPLAHGGPAIPEQSGLVFTGESTIRASQLEGLDLNSVANTAKPMRRC